MYILQNICIAYNKKGLQKEALEYYNKSLAICKKIEKDSI
jgi:hypothetical protein